MRHFITVIQKIQTEEIKAMAPRREVCEAFVEHADLYLKRTAWSSGCRSWFKQGKEDGPLSIWPGSRLLYFDLLAKPRYEDYDIDYTRRNPFAFLGNGFTVREYEGRDLSYYLGTPGNLGALLPGHQASQKSEGEGGQLSNGIDTNGLLLSSGVNSSDSGLRETSHSDGVVSSGMQA